MDQDQTSISEIIKWARSLPGDYVLTTEQTSEFLSGFGIAIKPNTLTTWRARRSTGPKWVRFPWRAVGYRVDDLRAYLDKLHQAAA